MKPSAPLFPSPADDGLAEILAALWREQARKPALSSDEMARLFRFVAPKRTRGQA